MNARFWNGLPSRVRGQLERALGEATAYANRMAREVEEEDLRKVVAAGTTLVHTPTPAERLALKKALLCVHAEMEGRVGKSLLRDVYAASAFTPDGP